MLPQRELEKSGIRVTCLGLGGFHICWTTESLAQATIEAALEEGVRFSDTPESYGPHISEERYGCHRPPRRRDRRKVSISRVSVSGQSGRCSFPGQVLPALQEAGIASPATKTLAHGRFFGRRIQGNKVTWETSNPVVPVVLFLTDCFHFALSLPVSVVITGAENPDFLREKSALVRSFHQMTADERQALTTRVAAYATEGKVEYDKADELRLPG